jgi:hypothetical protein
MAYPPHHHRITCDLPTADLPKVIDLFAVDSLTQIITKACADGRIGLVELKTKNSSDAHPLLGFCPEGFSLEVKDASDDAVTVELVKDSFTNGDDTVRSLTQLLPDVTIRSEINSSEEGKTVVLEVRDDRVEYSLTHAWPAATQDAGSHELGAIAPEPLAHVGSEDPNWPRF